MQKTSDRERVHASQLSIRSRIGAYLIILAGYFFYCYNTLILEYVRPYLVQDYRLTLQDTALFYTSQSTGLTIGSIAAAWIVTRFGRKRTLFLISLLTGLLTAANLFVRDANSWLLMRGLIGLVLGGYYVAAVSTMVSIFEPKYRARLAALNSAMFSASEAILGALGAATGEHSWQLLVWAGGIPPILVALLMLRLVPADDSFVAYGAESIQADLAAASSGVRTATWADMFHRRFVRLTITCLFLAGLNFSGYQFFSGFLTTYLKVDRHLDASSMGLVYSLTGVGSLIGGFAWGYLADKTGRRLNAVGFLGAGLLVSFYLSAPTSIGFLAPLGFAYGFCLSCSYCWAVYFTELFPVALRPMGAALFHAGHVVSSLAPSLVALVATPHSVAPGMWFAVPTFLLASALWLTLPETFKGGLLYKGYNAQTLTTGLKSS